ncbi:MAG TPA: hypothetical protein VGL19_24160 [Polyangiaceae bacterium]|jgi:hypothetical protein
MDRTKLKGYGAFALVFVLGMLIGGAGSRAMLQRRYARLFRDRFAVFEHRRLGALSRRLSLDDAQEEKVRGILSKYGQQRRELTRDIIDRCGAPLRAQKAQMDSEIRLQLRPEQQSRYDLLVRDSNGRGSVGDAGALEPLP